VLYGAIELTPLDTVTIAGYQIPRSVVTLGIVAAINLLFVLLFFKELKISSFDAALATTSGIHAGVMHYALMVLVAVTAVASFESVGNILVVAMFVVPPAAAYLLTDRLTRMVALSAVLAILSAVLGHIGALVVPTWFGFRSTTTAGMMAVAAGLLFLLAAAFGPRHGVLVKFGRRRMLAWQILSDDIVASLYRMEENGEQPPSQTILQAALFSDWSSTRVALWWLRRQGDVEGSSNGYRLTERGKQRARELIRSHRLWEKYLVSQADIPSERIHDKAEKLEHFTDRQLREQLDEETANPLVDPHGRPIPTEDGTTRTS
jgi:manganese/zinc/iron transport system permease protein